MSVLIMVTNFCSTKQPTINQYIHGSLPKEPTEAIQKVRVFDDLKFDVTSMKEGTGPLGVEEKALRFFCIDRIMRRCMEINMFHLYWSGAGGYLLFTHRLSFV